MEIVCPACSKPTILTADLVVCRHCGWKFRDKYGIFDFVNSPDRAEERSFYDGAYVGARKKNSVKDKIDSVSLKWDLPEAPENRIVLKQIGDLAGKTVLLLGNGESVKELMFLKMNPSHLVYSDLTTHALTNIADQFDLKEYQKQLTFAAIDAHAIPFADETFDVIYGFAMVHHLPDLDRFFASVMKALKPGGFAVFMDDAYAPLWHISKQTWLKPLMKYSHRKTGISPEDYRFSMSGGFKESELGEKIKHAGGEPWFIRASLLTYLFYRGSQKLLPRQLNELLRIKIISRTINAFDKLLCKLPLIRGNQLRLIYGFSKPQ
jgi:SAM-dependent methyltransferase